MEEATTNVTGGPWRGLMFHFISRVNVKIGGSRHCLLFRYNGRRQEKLFLLLFRHDGRRQEKLFVFYGSAIQMRQVEILLFTLLEEEGRRLAC